jgi:hypothetical protein
MKLDREHEQMMVFRDNDKHISQGTGTEICENERMLTELP